MGALVTVVEKRVTLYVGPLFMIMVGALLALAGDVLAASIWMVGALLIVAKSGRFYDVREA